MDNALFDAALPEGQGARRHPPLQGILQNALAIGVAIRLVAAVHGGLVTGGFHLPLQLAESQPGQRIEPMQADHRIEQRFDLGVMATQMGLLMEQHRPAGPAGQGCGQVDPRP